MLRKLAGRPAGSLALAWALPEWIHNLLQASACEGFPDPEKASRVRTLFDEGKAIKVPLLDSRNAGLDGLYFVDGRHRAARLVGSGAARIPVCLPLDVLNSIRTPGDPRFLLAIE